MNTCWLSGRCWLFVEFIAFGIYYTRSKISSVGYMYQYNNFPQTVENYPLHRGEVENWRVGVASTPLIPIHMSYFSLIHFLFASHRILLFSCLQGRTKRNTFYLYAPRMTKWARRKTRMVNARVPKNLYDWICSVYDNTSQAINEGLELLRESKTEQARFKT